jgi:ribonuclease HII
MKKYHKLLIEDKLRKQGYTYIAGMDEVHLCNLAGPIVACGLILNPDKPYIRNINDSKQLTYNQRIKLETIIKERAIDYAIATVTAKEINRAYKKYGEGSFRKLHYECFRRVIDNMKYLPDIVIVDHFEIPDLGLPQKAIKGGDTKSATIAGASILAKCASERIMVGLSKEYPNFSHWKNTYGNYCPQEEVALHRFGATPEHRVDFIERIINFSVGKIRKINGKFVIQKCPKRKCTNNLCPHMRYAKQYGLNVKCPKNLDNG